MNRVRTYKHAESTGGAETLITEVRAAFDSLPGALAPAP
ncbi:hypothetical protein FHS13_000512 [Nocardiopsis algeriensis]|uniref:Uncharacterized protein n=1 Tax=Nocardiopsis algeriensis TaxID=1478215 RepID=A0A841IKB2_9ACTN|nr:hypothetical protein [Nocardiopsis algeriensis]